MAAVSSNDQNRDETLNASEEVGNDVNDSAIETMYSYGADTVTGNKVSQNANTAKMSNDGAQDFKF